MALPKPDEGYIRDYREYLRGVWSRTHAHWHGVIDPWYWQTATIWPDGSGRSTYIPSTARALVDHAADVHMAFEPKFFRKPAGKGRKHEKDADQVEASLGAVFLDAMLHEPELAFKQGGKYAGQYGYVIIEGPILNLENRPEKPAKGKGESADEFHWREVDFKNMSRSWNPIRIRAPHPRNVLIDPTERMPSEAVKHQYLFVSRILGLLEGLRQRERKAEFITKKGDYPFSIENPFLNVEVTEYWSLEWHAMIAGNTLLFVEKNAYGFVPYNHAFSGFGGEQTEGFGDPWSKAQGLIDAVLFGLKVEAQGLSAKHNAIIERSYLRTRVGSMTDPAEIREQLDTEDGVVQADPDEVGFIDYPELGRSLFQVGNEVKDDISNGTFSRDIAGIRQQGVSTVGQQAILSTAATRKFASVNKQLNLMATIVGMNTLRLVDRLGITIELGGDVLSPSIIHNDYNIVAEFQTLDPILQQAERELGMREVQMGLKSPQTYRESDLRIRNESVEAKRLMKAEVRKSPPYIEAISREVAKEDGMLEAIENLRKSEEAEAMGTSVPGGGGSQPEISANAGGGATRALSGALTGSTAKPPQTPLPPNVSP